jgi:hypothetical protein
MLKTVSYCFFLFFINKLHIIINRLQVQCICLINKFAFFYSTVSVYNLTLKYNPSQSVIRSGHFCYFNFMNDLRWLWIEILAYLWCNGYRIRSCICGHWSLYRNWTTFLALWTRKEELSRQRNDKNVTHARDGSCWLWPWEIILKAVDTKWSL